MNELLTIEVLSVGLIIFSIVLAIFLSIISGRVSGLSYKISEMANELDHMVESKFTNLLKLVHEDLVSNNSTINTKVERMTEISREALDKAASDTHTDLDKFQHEFSKQNEEIRTSLAEGLGRHAETIRTSLAEGLGGHAETIRTSLAESLGGHAADVNDQFGMLRDTLSEEIAGSHQRLADQARKLSQTQQQKLENGLLSNSAKDAENFESINGWLEKSSQEISEKLESSLNRQSGQIGTAVERLISENAAVSAQNQDSSVVEQVADKRLNEDMAKVLENLSGFTSKVEEIESARSEMIELSKNMGIIAQALDDRRARGAVGEMVVKSLVSEVLSPSDYELKATLSNGEQVECLLKLPKPGGDVPISTKFDLSEMEILASSQATADEIETARKSFADRLSAAIQNTSSRCVIPGETADAAVLLLPSESAFIEAHTHHRSIIESANSKRVWIASPSTLIAMVNVARSVIKDATSTQEIERYRSEMSRIEDDYENLEQKLSTFARNFDNLMDTSSEIRKSARTIGERFEQVSGIIESGTSNNADKSDNSSALDNPLNLESVQPQEISTDR